MKRANWLFTLFVLCLCKSTVMAQTKADIFNGSTEITWLGIDFTQAKFIGSATQFKDAGEISSSEFRDKYVPSWNQLFIDEQKKYDVAGAVKRAEVKYAMEITEKANNGIKGNFFSEDPNDYKKLDEQKIAGLVKNYDFQGKPGIGMIFFIDGMSKKKEEASGWVTFVDMKSKKVLFTQYETGKAGGFGFKNYWAKTFWNMLKKTEKMKG
ncbi:MAG: hypothetical protein H7122_14045 [Chitinophagaceae bacterium]|nr:hypothetical protein [Chitinophagaceae bacterium]